MTVWEMYEEIHGDFNRVIDLFEDEQIAKDFVVMFLEDDSYENIHDAINKGDWNIAFRYVHSLKGLCTNMGFGDFSKVTMELTEQLRSKKPISDYSCLDKFDFEYNRLIELIKQVV